MNRKDADGNNVFEGGFLGLDNIGPIDRSAALPVAGHLEQTDGTAWMAMYCLNLLEIALVLAEHDATYEDMATKFFEHFAHIAAAMRASCGTTRTASTTTSSHLADGGRVPAAGAVDGRPPPAGGHDDARAGRPSSSCPTFARRLRLVHDATSPSYAERSTRIHVRDGHEGRLLSIVSPERLAATPRRHARRGRVPLAARRARAVGAPPRPPVPVDLGRHRSTRVDYEPAESTTGLFGGNSNWRGPVWFPVNHLVVEALRALRPLLRRRRHASSTRPARATR